MSLINIKIRYFKKFTMEKNKKGLMYFNLKHVQNEHKDKHVFKKK